MRLLKLKVKNIASLKGDHLINFQEIESASPLFAITGETGAGKSTILNCIGLALYGQVYKKSLNQIDVVTLGEKEGLIELILEIKNQRYLAIWRAKIRKPNGELYSTPQSPNREIYTLSGGDFDSPKTIQNKKVEEILNLDFDQFCKCIILNQGEFARFLTSSFTERKEILEKLYPGEMLESLSSVLRSDLDHLLKEKEELEVGLKTLRDDAGETMDLPQEKESLETKLITEESWLILVESVLFHFQSLRSYHSSYSATQSKIEALKKEMNAETTDFNHRSKQLEIMKEKLNNLQESSEKELPRLQELLQEEGVLGQKTLQQDEKIKELVKIRADLKNYDSQLKQLQETIVTADHKVLGIKQKFKFPLPLLTQHQKKLPLLFESFTQLNFLSQELIQKEDRLSELEKQGTLTSSELKKTEEKIKLLPENPQQELKELEEKKKAWTLLSEKRVQSKVKAEDLDVQLKHLRWELAQLSEKKKQIENSLETFRNDLAPLETSLKLQEYLGAIELCLHHPQLLETGECPVCHSRFLPRQWVDLQAAFAKTDIEKVKSRHHTLSRNILQNEADYNSLSEREKHILIETHNKETEIKVHLDLLKEELPSSNELDKKLEETNKAFWELTKLGEDCHRLTEELKKSRGMYLVLRDDIKLKQGAKQRAQGHLQEIERELKELIPMGLTSSLMPELKTDSLLLVEYLEQEAKRDKLMQEKTFKEESAARIKTQETESDQLLGQILLKVNELQTKLTSQLGNKKASEIIQELNHKLTRSRDSLGQHEHHYNEQKLKLNSLGSRQYELGELLKNQDVAYENELHLLKEMGKKPLPSLYPELDFLKDKICHLAVALSDSSDLFVPMLELIDSQKSGLKERISRLKSDKAKIESRLEQWERKQDKIKLSELKHQEVKAKFDRMKRLDETLGRDELRTFVLSLVEENLIVQTNEELQKLCQGRYEIVHQSRKMRMTPDFWILDKFKDGGLRKISTLSGGETFMVSLAMAFALAEMTRGQAEIDSLFIDEGFGTLDQESLEDVLDMLQQIQTRGLMVGIISHIKSLTNSLPVNLLVSKKADGTSTLNIQYN